MRILLLSPNQINRYNWGHQLFRDEIGRQHDVVYYGEGYPNYGTTEVSKIIKAYGQFDLVLTYGLRYSMPFEGMGNIKVKKAHIVIDLFPPHPAGYVGGMHTRYKPFIHKNKYDIMFYRQRVQANYLKEIGCMALAYWLPFSVDINRYKKLDLLKIHDIITSATTRSDIYPNRKKVNAILKKMKLRSVTGRIEHDAYIRSINQSKIAIISTNVFNSPNMKFTEFTSCGTFVLADKPADFDELGFKDGEHMVLYKDLEDLQDKIRYYLKHEKERGEIAERGMNFVRENHNNSVRVEQFTKIMEENIL